MVGRFWLIHHRFFGEVTAFDGRLLTLNIFYLSGVVLTGLWMAASARRAGLTSTDAAAHHEQRYRSLYIAAVFLASIPVALVAPSLAPLMWLALFFDPAARFASKRAKA